MSEVDVEHAAKPATAPAAWRTSIARPAIGSTKTAPTQQLWRQHRVALRCSLAGIAVWAISLAPLALEPRANLPLRLTATLSLSAALAGAWQLQNKHRLARHLGVSLFVGLAILSWALASVQGVLGNFDRFQAALGALAWAVFGSSWTHPWSVPEPHLVEAPEGDTLNLKPRRPPQRHSTLLVAFGAACGLACVAMAATVAVGSRGVLAQVIAYAAAIALVSLSARIGTVGDKPKATRASGGRPWLRAGLRAMIPVLIAAGAAVLVYVSRFASTAG